MNIEEALVNLMKDVSTFKDTTKALNDAKNVLGYDPTQQMQNYDVALIIDFEAMSPEGAVGQFINSIIDDTDSWVYKVTGEDGKEFWIDGFNSVIE